MTQRMATTRRIASQPGALMGSARFAGLRRAVMGRCWMNVAWVEHSSQHPRKGITDRIALMPSRSVSRSDMRRVPPKITIEACPALPPPNGSEATVVAPPALSSRAAHDGTTAVHADTMPAIVSSNDTTFRTHARWDAPCFAPRFSGAPSRRSPRCSCSPLPCGGKRRIQVVRSLSTRWPT